jgi:glutaryl-CoA dehydrogenase
MAKLNPFDLYDVAALLSEEELMIKESVARFVDERAMPLIARHFDEATFPAELVPRLPPWGCWAPASRAMAVPV